jgi:hypothetical protein
MMIRHTHSFFFLGIVTFFTLAGAVFSTARELHRQGVSREPQGHTIAFDDVGFLIRYYNQGASAGSILETITNRE